MSTTGLNSAFEALRRDLLAEEGPRISTMRNYRFAILPYRPEAEFEVRRKVRQLSDELKARGWSVLDISLHRLLLQRLKSLDSSDLQRLMETEKRQYKSNPEKALNRVKDQVGGLIGGEDGLAADLVRIIDEFAETQPHDPEKTLIWIKRVGALYPFYRSSTLLKHLDGKTRQIPVVLLYPGEQRDKTALSFMGEFEPDRDYRPRIYASETF